jgi:NAD+ synthase (glutamine-hydrolysing)
VVGTGDMSELALGWCTYNADHMANYAVNVSVRRRW